MAEFAALDLRTVTSPESEEQSWCAGCDCELRENITGYRYSKTGARCSDCYFDDISVILERYPVGLPGVRR